MSKVLREDMKQIVSDTNIPWNALCGRTVLVTGATGLIGGALVRALSVANEEYKLDLRLIAHGRNKDRGEALAQELGLEFIRGDIRSSILAEALPGKLDYIFHCASITKSVDMVAKPVDTITTAVSGTRNILELAKEKNCESIVCLSSMEVYGQTELAEVKETDLGYLNLSNSRSSYPESKRLCESMCIAYATQYNIPVKIARLAQTFGAGTPKDDTRVFAQFARSAISGKDLILHTEGKSRGNYCYTADTVRGLLTLLLQGVNREIYNIANRETSMTVREMAGLVANEVCGGKIKVVVDKPAESEMLGYAPDAGYMLNTDKLEALGWRPRYGLDEMYRRMLADWQEGI